MNNFAQLLILGNAGAGKTSLAKRFAQGIFNEYESRTHMYNLFFQPVAVNDKTIKFEIRDFGGKGTSLYAEGCYREADAAMIVYDITNKESFRRAKKFVNQLRKKCKLNIVMTLAGNKADLLDARKVAAEEAQAYAQENGLFFMETSAKTETNVYDMFYEIAKRLPIEKRLPDHSHHQPLLNPFSGYMYSLFGYGVSFLIIIILLKALLWVLSYLLWALSYLPMGKILQVIFVLILSLPVLFCFIIFKFSRMRLA